MIFLLVTVIYSFRWYVLFISFKCFTIHHHCTIQHCPIYKYIYEPFKTCSPASIALWVALFAFSAIVASPIDPVAECTPSPFTTGLLLAHPMLHSHYAAVFVRTVAHAVYQSLTTSAVYVPQVHQDI